MLRHSKAVHRLQAGLNLIYIRDLLGHVDVSTTQIYTRVDVELRRRALEAALLPGIELPQEESWTASSGWSSSLRRIPLIRDRVMETQRGVRPRLVGVPAPFFP